MGVNEWVTELDMEVHESQNERDKRVEDLWKQLDVHAAGYLDLKGLQKGLRRIDHPMKNADDLLKKIMDTVDTNADGKIEYYEFRAFVEQAERQLLMLFRSIDRDHNGKLDKNELQEAFRGAGLVVPMRRISAFFDDIDMNNDGYISFDEWRDFLLFMPTHDSKAPLEAVLSFYSSIVTLTSEGDSMVTEDTLEGLGTTGFLLNTLFGSILRIAQPMDREKSAVSTSPQPGDTAIDPETLPLQNQRALFADQSLDIPASPNLPTQDDIQKDKSLLQTYVAAREAALKDGYQTITKTQTGAGTPGASYSGSDLDYKIHHRKRIKLTDFIPDAGYFLAGAIAGGVSRTATAPLDRLKVYLLVSTRPSTETAMHALRQGKPLVALHNAGRPFGDAVRDLWKTGGLRSFFAGNGLNVIKIMPESAIKFGSYEAAKRALARLEGHNDPKKINAYSKFTAGGIAGMVAQFCVYPLDTLKFRLQSSTIQGGLTGNALLADTAKKMWMAGGFRSTYRGVTMGLVGMFPYSAIDMGMFELLKSSYRKYMANYKGVHEEDAVPGNIMTGVIGASSGAIGATVVYPLNVLRTRLQTQGTAMHPATYTGIWDVTHKTIKNEGYRGLYKGLTPNILKVAPALSITWIMYENSKRILGLE